MSEFRFEIPMESGATSRRGILSVAEIVARATKIVQDKLEQYKTDGLKLPAKDQFLKAASDLYDSLCQMIDVPMLPELIERQVEAVMKPAFMRAVEMAYDAFVG